MVRRGSIGMLIVSALAMLGGCNIFGSNHSYRYRITVEIDTPDGLKTGSAVQETVVSKSRFDVGDISGKRGMRTRGEAVAVDLPGGQTLFAMLPDPNLTQAVLDPEWNNDWVESAKRIGRGDTPTGPLPMIPNQQSNPAAKPSGYPKLVRFRDSADPKTVEAVDPNDLASSFGKGVRLRRIVLQPTDEQVTTGIGKRLPSFGPGTGFDVWIRTIPYGDPRGISFNDFISPD